MCHALETLRHLRFRLSLSNSAAAAAAAASASSSSSRVDCTREFDAMDSTDACLLLRALCVELAPRCAETAAASTHGIDLAILVGV